MDVLLQALMNPSQMTRPQLLLLVIMFFVLVASIYFVWRLYRIVVTARKTPYVPNIGLKRKGAVGVRPGTGEPARNTGRRPGSDHDSGSSTDGTRPTNTSGEE